MGDNSQQQKQSQEQEGRALLTHSELNMGLLENSFIANYQNLVYFYVGNQLLAQNSQN